MSQPTARIGAPVLYRHDGGDQTAVIAATAAGQRPETLMVFPDNGTPYPVSARYDADQADNTWRWPEPTAIEVEIAALRADVTVLQAQVAALLALPTNAGAVTVPKKATAKSAIASPKAKRS